MKNYLLGVLCLFVSFAYSQNPTVTNISPTSASGSVLVTLVGTNFTSAKSVILRSGVDVSVPFRVVNPTTIVATVNLGPSKYINGRNGAKFIVTNGSGSNTTSPNFDYTVQSGTCNDIFYSDWTACSNGKQTRTYLASPTGCTTKPPKDSLERKCETPNVRYFQYNPNDTTIGIISNLPGILEIKNSSKQIVESYSYDEGSNTISLSHLSSGEYTANTAGKFVNISTKFQVVIESSDINYLVVKGKYGTAPYTYSINSTSNYSSSISLVMAKTNYTVRCKDATGKVVALTVKNTYTNCTLTTTSTNYNRGTGDEIDTTGITLVPLYTSEQYMSDLAAAANNTTKTTARGSTRDRTLPVCSITSPANNATVSGVVSIIATATDNVGVTGVTLSINGVASLQTPAKSGSTYTFSWNTVGLATGIYTISVRASDAAGNAISSSRQVGVGVDPLADITPPSVSFGSGWYSGLTVPGATTYSVPITATDNVGVTLVTLILDSTTTVGTDATLPYTINWNTTGLSAGVHYLKAIATDAKANTTATTIVVNVDNTNILFKSTITSPTVDTSLYAGPTITLAATCTATNGVSKVEFYNTANLLIGTDFTAPYTASWNTTGLAGTSYTTYTIWAKVTDSLGNVMVFTPSIGRNITVYNPATPPPSGIPTTFSLVTPPVANQGGEGSCAAFSCGYYAASMNWYYKTLATSYSTATNIFSPEYMYNLALVLRGYPGQCSSGSGATVNCPLVRDSGICTWNQMPYTSGTCNTLPNSTQRADAATHKMTYSQIRCNDTIAIKNALIAKHPIMISIEIDNNFYNAGPGYIWRTFGTDCCAHAVTIVGWDDNKHAWKIVNSWGTGWGDAGFLWVDYDLFQTRSFFYVWYYN